MAIRIDFRNRKADVGHRRYVLVPRIGEIPTAHLGTAFEQMAGHGGAREAVPIVVRPAEMRQGGPHHQRRIGHSAAHDDLGASPQCRRDRLGADVGVGTDDFQAVHSRAKLLAQQSALLWR